RTAAWHRYDRLPDRLADECTEGNLHGPRPPHEKRHRPQVRDVLLQRERILAHEEEARYFPPHRHPARPDAGNPLIRVNLDDVNSGVGRRHRLPSRVERLWHRVLEEADLNGGGLHGRAPWLMRWHRK